MSHPDDEGNSLVNRTFSTFRKRREEKHGPAAQAPTAPQNRLDRRPERADPAPTEQPAVPTDGLSDNTGTGTGTGHTVANGAGLTQPFATPAASQPEASPESEAPETPGSDAEPDATTPRDIASSDVETPDVETPEVETPEVEAREDEAREDEAAEDAAVDDGAEPIAEATAPAADVPEPQTPEIETPGAEASGVEASGAETAEAAATEDESPQFESPGFETPGLESSGLEPSDVETPAVETPDVETPAVESPEPAAVPPEPERTGEAHRAAAAPESTVTPHLGFSDAETTRFAAVPPTQAATITPAGSPADDNETERINTGSEAATERINIGKAAPPARPAAQAPPAGNWKAEPAAPQYIPAGGGNPQQRPPENKPKKSRKGLWASLVALVAIIAAVVVVALIAGSGEEPAAPADVAADRALEYVAALQDGNIVLLRSITCGEALERFTTMSDQEFAEDHQIQKANNELVGVDGVKASKIIDDGDAAVVEVIAYKTATPDEKLDVALTLSKVDGEWKVCKA